MNDRVRELRRRLEPVLEVVSASARRDLEELFELASRSADENENTRLLRELRDSLDLVELATGVKKPRGAARPKSESVPRGPRGARRERSREVPEPPVASEAVTPSKVRVPRSEEPTLVERIRGVLEREGRPLARAEITERLLAEGWRTKSPQPGNVVSAVLTNMSDVTREAGKYVLVRGSVAVEPVAESAPARRRGPHPDVPLGARVHAIVARRGAAMSYADILSELERDGWTSSSARKRDLVANAVRLHPDLTVVLPGVVWLKGAAAEPAVSVRPEDPAREPAVSVPAEDPADEPAADPEVLAWELAFLRQHVEDARDDTAVLAPVYAARQVSAWAARARFIADRGKGELAAGARELVRELTALVRPWALGRSIPALVASASPRDALAPFVKSDADLAEASWESVADRLDAQLESAYDDAAFDDGWSDTRWLADDERFASGLLERAESLLERIGTPVESSADDAPSLSLAPRDVRELVEAARGLRWIRGVVLDGSRWARCAGRLRWLAQKNPTAKESKLAEVLSPEFHPAGTGWGFDDDAREEKRGWLAGELAFTDARGLREWLESAVDVYDDGEIAGLLAARRSELAQVDLRAFESRRVRARVAKLREAMGVAPAGKEAALPDLGDEPARAPRFGTVRALLAGTLEGRRALMLANRADERLEWTLASAFDLDLDWAVATPRRAALAVETIQGGKHDLVLSATGFQTPAMDASFAAAAREVNAAFIRVNRGRVASCARALGRGLADAGESGIILRAPGFRSQQRVPG
jgi:hypothetical protein